MFGKDLYFISILGTPSEKSPWMLQFGGHHLALNITIAGDHGVLTPTLTGAQPSLYTLNGKTIRPLGAESDKALELLNSLDENQRKQAVLSFRLADLVLGPGQDGKTIQPEGLKASSMNDKQRRHAAWSDFGEWVVTVNEMRNCRTDGRTEGRGQRDVVRLERPGHRGVQRQHRGVLPHSGAPCRDRIRAATNGRRCVAARPHYVSRSDQ